MTWKKANNSDAGTATKFGGNDIDKISDSFNGVDVSDPIKYNTDINTLYATTNAAGDLLKSNGTKYVRLPRGTANQVLAVNSGGTDVAWATGAGGGEANTAANVGTGTGTIFRDKTSVTLNLKTLLAGSNITLTNNANDVTIASTGGGSSNLDGLTDVTITTPSTGQVVKYNGTVWTNQTDDVGSGTWSASATETLTNKTIDNDLNTLKIPWPDMLVYKAGSTIKAKNMHTGAVLGTTSTTDASVVIQAASNSIPLGASAALGGVIGITSGLFPCLTELTINYVPGIRLIGAGRNATKLNFTPASALTNGIRFQLHWGGMEHITVVANANVTNMVRVVGNGRHGIISYCDISGPSSPPVSGQIGIFLDGTSQAIYYWKIIGCQFWGLDIGIKIGLEFAHGQYLNMLQFDACNKGILVHTAQNMIFGVLGQGSTTVGDVLVDLGNGTDNWAAYNNLQGIGADLWNKSGSTIVRLNNLAQNNSIFGVSNSGGQTVIDNSGKPNKIVTGQPPLGVTSITPPGSGVTWLNNTGSATEVFVRAGTVSQIDIVRVGTATLTGMTAGNFMLEPNDGIKVTYSAAPTIFHVPH